MEIHQKALHARQSSPTLGALIAAVETQFAQWTKGNDTLRRLCAV